MARVRGDGGEEAGVERKEQGAGVEEGWRRGKRKGKSRGEEDETHVCVKPWI